MRMLKEYEKTHLTRSGALGAAKRSKEPGVLRVPPKEILDYDFAYFVVREDLLPHIHKLIIPAAVEYIESMSGDPSCGPYGYRNNPFAEILVEEGNPSYASLDGVLFTKDMRELICYPCGKPGKEYHIPDGVEVIRREAFLNVEHLERVYLPGSVQSVEGGAFCGYRKLDFPELVVIRKVGVNYLIEFPRDGEISKKAYCMYDGKVPGEAGEDIEFLIENCEFDVITAYDEKCSVLAALFNAKNEDDDFWENIDPDVESIYTKRDAIYDMLRELKAHFYSEQE